MLSAPSTRESLPPRPPSGALRPPVAVGPLTEGEDGGPFGTRSAFSTGSGAGSEFLMTGFPKSCSGAVGGAGGGLGYGGWTVEAGSLSHPSSGGSGVCWSNAMPGQPPPLPSGGWAAAEVGFELPVPVGGVSSPLPQRGGGPPTAGAGQKEDLIAELTTLGRGPSSFPNSEAPTDIMEAPPTSELGSIPPPAGLLNRSTQFPSGGEQRGAWQQASGAWRSSAAAAKPCELASIAPPPAESRFRWSQPPQEQQRFSSAMQPPTTWQGAQLDWPVGSVRVPSSYQPTSGATCAVLPSVSAPFGSPAYTPGPSVAPPAAAGAARPVPSIPVAGLGSPGRPIIDELQGPPDLFSMLDRNHDGIISRSEFEGALAPAMRAAPPLRRGVCPVPPVAPGFAASPVPYFREGQVRTAQDMQEVNAMVAADMRPPATDYQVSPGKLGAGPTPSPLAPFGSPNYMPPPSASPPSTEWATPPATGDLPLIAASPQPVGAYSQQQPVVASDLRSAMPPPPVSEVVAPYKPALPPAPLPPAWQGDSEQRPHILEVQLDEVQVSKSALKTLDLRNTDLSYFVSLHPLSERLDAVRLPLDAPRQTKEGQHLVSKVHPAKHTHQDPGVEHVDTLYCARYEELLETKLEQLELHLLAYLWASKGGGYFSSGSVILLGRGCLPLRDYKLQRRPTKWGIFNVASGDKVAEIHLSYGVCTSPGPVLKPTLTDVKETEVTLRWDPPVNDHGAPVLGYKVSILMEGYSGTDWMTLCEKTKTTNPVYVVTNLKGNTKYLMDIRAINRVGASPDNDGPHVFEIATAPVPPEPPSKPWIEEIREGCLCIAWTKPDEDGGAPITAYKVKMRKTLGGTRYGFWSGGSPTWIDMGTVGAAMNQHVVDQPAVYTAWVGPLEQTACEYRFQVVALNRAGVSNPSLLSDAHYT